MIIFLPIILTCKIPSIDMNIGNTDYEKEEKSSYLLAFNLTIAFNRNRP
jgi:hypothetical protein